MKAIKTIDVTHETQNTELSKKKGGLLQLKFMILLKMV